MSMSMSMSMSISMSMPVANSSPSNPPSCLIYFLFSCHVFSSFHRTLVAGDDSIRRAARMGAFRDGTLMYKNPIMTLNETDSSN